MSLPPDERTRPLVDEWSEPGLRARRESQALGHIDYVDGLRGACALFVVAHHFARWNLDGLLQADRVTRTVAEFLRSGHYAVDVFITVSGFCLALPVLRSGGVLLGGASAFFRRRIKRILPPYYAAMAISLVMIATVVGNAHTGTPWDRSAAVTPFGVLTHVLLIQDLFPWLVAEQINAPFWSIAIEWQIYYLFPWLVLAWGRFGFARVVGVVSIVTILVSFLLRNTQQQYLFLHYIALFSFGGAAAKIAFSRDPDVARWRSRIPWGGLAMAGVAVLVPAGHYLHWDRWARLWSLVDPVCGLAAACALIFFAVNPNAWATRLFRIRVLVKVGVFSYSLYLIHAPFLQWIWQFQRSWGWGAPLRFWTGLLLGTWLLLGVAFLFHLAFEKPFLRRRRLAPPTAPGAPDRTRVANRAVPAAE